MRIAVIGTGSVGAILGTRWAQNGHEVAFGTRNPAGDKVKELLLKTGNTAVALSPPEAAAKSDVIVLAVPWDTAESTVKSLGDLSGKIVVDCMNPLDGLAGLKVGHSSSGAETVARWVPNARVVKAFNSTGANNMKNPVYGGQKTAMFVCGDDDEAVGTVRQLSDELGFETHRAGQLEAARYLEPLAMLWIKLAYQQGMGREIAFALLKR
jgi:NADPH-dependent F420 reductase